MRLPVDIDLLLPRRRLALQPLQLLPLLLHPRLVREARVHMRLHDVRVARHELQTHRAHRPVCVRVAG